MLNRLLAALAATLLAPTSLLAMAPPMPPPILSAPQLVGASLTSELWEVDCRRVEVLSHCEIVGTFHYDADGGGPYAGSVEHTLAGFDVTSIASADGVLQLDRGDGHHPRELASVRFVVAGKPLLTLTVRATVRRQWRDNFLSMMPAAYARHVVVGDSSPSASLSWDYGSAPARGGSSFRAVVLLPESHVQPGQTSKQVVTDRRSARFVAAEPAIINGGPVLTLGGTIEDDTEFRLGLGYEIAGPDWLLFRLGIDTDFDDDLIIAPVIEAATPQIFVIPSVSAGLGMALRTPLGDRPTEVGVRLLAGMHVLMFGIVAHVDIFPSRDANVVETTFSARFTL